MADIQIRIRDKETSGDAETDARQFKRGDVISVWETPGPWGSGDLTNPDWRIVRLPNVSAADVGELLAPELDQLGQLRRKRRAALNLDSLPAEVLTWLADDSRAAPIFSSPITLPQFLALITAKAPRSGMRVL